MLAEQRSRRPAGQHDGDPQHSDKSNTTGPQGLAGEQADRLDLANRLLAAGLPVVVCGPNPPAGWQRLTADQCDLSSFRPGVDALALVTGHGLDVVDFDSKVPENSLDNLPPFEHFGVTTTPSGGKHFLVASSLEAGSSPLPGVGDYRGGLADGGSRGLAYLPGSARAKYPGDEYVETERWQILDCLLAAPDTRLTDALMALRRKPKARDDGYSGPPYSDLAEQEQRLSDAHVDAVLFDWQVALGVAQGWPEGERDQKGRGWEALARDFAWALARLAACPWVALGPDDAECLYGSMLPEVIASDSKCSGKWRSDLIAKAIAQPADPPPWAKPTSDLAELFERTAVLRHIRDAAHSRAISAPVVLANTLGLVLLLTNPCVTLPPVVGSSASLNLGFALVGESGATKTTSADVARELLGVHIEDHWVRPIGSGEGLIDAYYRWRPKDPDNENSAKVLGLADYFDRRCMFVVDEGEMLGKQSARAGATLAEYLRTSLTGGMLGATNRKTGTSGDRTVPSKSYRLVSVVNIHPEHADVLLHGESTGYPQRFLWVPSSDPTLPTEVKDLPEWPGPLDWRNPNLFEGDVIYPEDIADQVRQAALDRAHGKLPPRSGHAILTRLKVALALALLHGEGQITHEWWEMAGVLSEMSLTTQDECLAVMADQRQRSEDRKATVSARAQGAAYDDQLRRAVGAVVERLRKRKGEELPWRDAKPHSRLLKDVETEDVIDGLRTQVGVVVTEFETKTGGVGWRLRFDG